MKVIKKPWGQEEIVEKNDRYMVKKLTMLKGHRCSLQYHQIKRETIYVLSGELRISFGFSRDNLEARILGPNETVTIVPQMVHRMEAIQNSIYLEASSPEMEDVVRLDDDYQRELK